LLSNSTHLSYPLHYPPPLPPLYYISPPPVLGCLSAAGETVSTSFACDLKKWLDVADVYAGGSSIVYHTTMPTDALRGFRDAAHETVERGYEVVRDDFNQLGNEIREMMDSKGLKSVAAEGFKAPGVAVYYTDDPGYVACTVSIFLALPGSLLIVAFTLQDVRQVQGAERANRRWCTIHDR
jgi:hypothetical protein